ncbi:MAG: family transcriptional regulator, cAMP and macrophage regulator [Actinomycetota bacterium]|nr:family transcriptional regulator, cAMP and macrophage regulator [Actinomycetota bacterium]
MDRQAEWIAQFFGRPELAPLRFDDIEELVALLRDERHLAGTTIFRMGETPTRVGILRSGAVELSRNLNGRRVVIQILRPGDAVGDVGVFLRTTAPYDSVALEDSVVLWFDFVDLHRLLEQRPRLALRWLVSVSDRLVSYQDRLMELLAGGLEAQIASVLVRRAERGLVKLSQSSLAELVGGRRTSVNRVLKHLEEQKLLRLRYAQIEILDEAGLAIIAGLERT